MQSNTFNYNSLLIFIPIILSLFTHIWNPIGFLYPEHDEGIYLQRTMRVLEEIDFRDPSFGYDHPFFGQLFLAGVLGMVSYPDSISPEIGDLHSIETLWIVPRLLMAFLAVIDTILVYKIAELRYNRNVGLVASIIFAVMPITWLLRMVWLDSILLPFLLSSILFSIYLPKNNLPNGIKNKNIPLVLLSGIFLGLAIFTKIPAFTMIPLVGSLIFMEGSNKRNWSMLGMWIIPVILIPLIWPAYAMYVGQLDLWITGIYDQANRTGGSLFNTIEKNIKIDPILLTIGFFGIIYAAIKRDLFILLWIFPYALFLYLIGWSQYFHFILIFPAFCIAPALAIFELSKKVKNAKAQKVLPFFIISVIGFFGLANTSMLITQNYTSPYFTASSLLIKYLQDNSNEKITVISNPFYFWIPQYVFDLDHDYYSYLGVGSIKTQKLILIVDDGFRELFSANDDYALRLQKLYKSYDKNVLATFKNTTILLSNVLHPSSETSQINLLDKNHIWSPFNNAALNQENDTLTIKVDTSNGRKLYNRAFLPIHINDTSTEPLLLTLDYFAKSIKGQATFLAEIIEYSPGYNITATKKVLWSSLLDNTSRNFTSETFFLPYEIANRPVELRLYIITQHAGEHFLTIKNMRII